MWDESAVLPKYPFCQTSAPPEKEVERTRAATFRDLRSWPKIRKYRRNGVTSPILPSKTTIFGWWCMKILLEYIFWWESGNLFDKAIWGKNILLRWIIFPAIGLQKCSCLCEILVRCVHGGMKIVQDGTNFENVKRPSSLNTSSEN